MILPYSEEIYIRQLENVFNDMTNSYKIFWFLGLFDEIILNKKEITFKEIVARMIIRALYPLLNYNLNFGSQDKMAKNIIKLNSSYFNDKDIQKNTLYKELVNTTNPEIEKILEEFYRYVPYRLLRGFYKKELRGVKDGIINKSIEELSLKDSKVFYKIYSNDKKIIMNNNWFDYIYKNQNIIKGWVNYKLILFLQHRNPTVPAIPFKLEPPLERDLKVARKFWDLVIRNVDIKDIYTGKRFTEESYLQNGKLSIDHFLPWSFVGHDELWNLTPTFASVNSSKSNSLPLYNKYIDSFSELQYKAIDYMRHQKDAKRYLEGYLNIDKTVNIKEIINVSADLNKDKFIRAIKRTINPLYQIAYNQGFSEWSYDYRIENKEIIVDKYNIKLLR